MSNKAFSSVALDTDQLAGRKVTSHLVTSENTLLNLASYPSCITGIEYALAFRFEMNGSNVIYARFVMITYYYLEHIMCFFCIHLT